LIGKSMQKVAEYVDEHGWEVCRRTRKGNLVLTKPGCSPVTVSGNSGDRRAQENALSLLRREDRALAQKGVQQNP
jgi:hypothetical protein